MQLNPYLTFNGQCEAAFKFYERVLGAKEVFNNGQNPPTCLISLGGVWFEIYAAEKSLPDTAFRPLP